MTFKASKIWLAGLMTAALCTTQGYAKVPAAEAAKLGNELTPIGGEKAGNADGTIPEWTGGLKDIPAGFVPGSGDYIDPYADDSVLFTITKDNMADYADKLSEGQKAMLEKYATYQMPVYTTRRSANYSDVVNGWAKANAENAELIAGGNGIAGAEGSFVFPIPANALEAIWNHITRYRGGSFNRVRLQVTPTVGGDYTVVKFFEEYVRRNLLQDYATNKDDNVMFYFKQAVTSPARLAGNVLLAHETIDQVKEPRRAWIYNAGQRRVRRAPQVGYDGPATASDGLRTADNFDMYNGAPDRYNWTLEGKQELYIPYNSYKLDSKDIKYDDLIKPGHLDPTNARYELHRVWKVVADLKDGARHVYSKRVYYIDEDSWQIAVVDHYDGRGELWRFAEGHSKYYYDAQTIFYTIETIHDLLSGRYLAGGITNEERASYTFDVPYKARDFTPAALRRSGKR